MKIPNTDAVSSRIHTLDGQLAAFREHSHRACDLAAHVLNSYRDRVLSEAEDRLRAGFPAYGSTTWNLSEDEIWVEAMEEVADLVNYLVMMLERRRCS